MENLHTTAVRSKILKKEIPGNITFCHHTVSRINSISQHYSDLNVFACLFFGLIFVVVLFGFFYLIVCFFDWTSFNFMWNFFFLVFVLNHHLHIIFLNTSIIDDILNLHRLCQTKMKVMHSYFMQNSLHLPLKR